LDDRICLIKLTKWLEGHGMKVWFNSDIDYVAKWKAGILKQLDDSTVVLGVMSKSSWRSIWVVREINRTKERNITVVAVLLEPDGHRQPYRRSPVCERR
jgi:hypothetical protein